MPHFPPLCDLTYESLQDDLWEDASRHTVAKELLEHSSRPSVFGYPQDLTRFAAFTSSSPHTTSLRCVNFPVPTRPGCARWSLAS